MALHAHEAVRRDVTTRQSRTSMPRSCLPGGGADSGGMVVGADNGMRAVSCGVSGSGQ
jgi:hypothetical protein